MKIFIDSGDLKEIRDAAAMGVVDEATTNPTLVAKAARPPRASSASICEVVDGPMSAAVHTYISSWRHRLIGRIDHVGGDGMLLIRQIVPHG